MRAYFHTLGCKVNQYETNGIIASFKKRGIEISDNPSSADIFVINSCTVTSVADKKTRQLASRFKRDNEGSIVAVTGCYTQVYPEKAQELDFVDVVCGVGDKLSIVDLCLEAYNTKKKVIDVKPVEEQDRLENMAIGEKSGRIRGYLKVQNGCDNFCSYCIIPTARGSVQWKPLADVVTEAKSLISMGYKEIVFVGINLCFYGRGSKTSLVDAVEAVAELDPNIRIRLGSLEPGLLSKKDIRRLSEIENFQPAFHLSLQSGSDSVLTRMNRKYGIYPFIKIVENIRKYFNNPSITSDVIVGFPGETDKEFQETVKLIEKIIFSKVHLFPFSPRAGTVAAILENPVDSTTKKKRVKILEKVTSGCRREFLETNINLETSILFESEQGGYYTGYTENYVSAYLKSDTDIVGQILPVRVLAVFGDGLKVEQL